MDSIRNLDIEMQVFIFASVILIATGFVLAIIALARCQSPTIPVLIFSAFVGLSFYCFYRQNEIQDELARELIAQGYTHYVNGIEVSGENISLKNYHRDIDHEEKKIFLTN